MTRACGRCGSDISHKRKDAKYCSRTCKCAAHQARTVSCPELRERRHRKDRARYAGEAERRRQYAREVYWANPEAFRDYSREWRQQHPHRRRSQRDLRANLIESHPDYRPFPEWEWERLKRRWNYSCAYCGASDVRLEMDHVVPISRGGRHAIANILPACVSCNRSKFNHFLSEWRYRERG